MIPLETSHDTSPVFLHAVFFYLFLSSLGLPPSYRAQPLLSNRALKKMMMIHYTASLTIRSQKTAYSDIIRRSASFCERQNTLRSLRRTRLVVEEHLAFDAYTHNLPCIDIHALCRWCVEQFVRGRERRGFAITALSGFVVREPEESAFAGVTAGPYSEIEK